MVNIKIGTQISSGKGYKNIGRDALSIGANTAQFFLRNPRGTKSKKFNEEDMVAFREIIEAEKFAPVVAHCPYTMNLCSKDPHLRELSIEMLAQDIERLEYIPGNYYVLHPGNHGGQGSSVAIDQIVEGLNQLITDDQTSVILLETMSGKGTEMGRTFEELAEIIDSVKKKDNVGVCFDTCHTFSAGYDIVDDLDGTLISFDRTVGLGKLKAIHLNDSQFPLGSNKDRHAPLGEGEIGIDAILAFVQHEVLRDLPFILETPFDLEGHKKEITKLKSMIS